MDIFRKPRIISSNDKDKYYRFVGGTVSGNFVDLSLPDLSGSATILTDVTLDLSYLENDIINLNQDSTTIINNVDFLSDQIYDLQVQVAALSGSLSNAAGGGDTAISIFGSLAFDSGIIEEEDDQLFGEFAFDGVEQAEDLAQLYTGQISGNFWVEVRGSGG